MEYRRFAAVLILKVSAVTIVLILMELLGGEFYPACFHHFGIYLFSNSFNEFRITTLEPLCY